MAQAMALTSSPPLRCLDLPSSPPPTHPTCNFPIGRQFVDDDPLSSDPIFSEDASESEERPGEKRKRNYKGPWWRNTRHNMQSRKPTKFADSGVWLASEMSEDGFSLSLSSAAPRDSTSEREHAQEAILPEGSQVDSCVEQALPSAEHLAAQIVLDCVDNSRQTIDLSEMSLKHLPGASIKPLHQMIRARDMDQPDSDTFQPLTPELQIFLYNNRLHSLPDELWSLENTTVLSLRNNAINELPGFVGKLQRLKELNLAGNELHWLPWELLDLIRLRQGHVLRLITHPNPLWLPVSSKTLAGRSATSFADPARILAEERRYDQSTDNENAADEKTLSTMIARVASTWLTRRRNDECAPSNMAPVFGAASAVRYFDITGGLASGSAKLPTISSEDGWPADPDASPNPELNRSTAHSMFEVAAQTLRSRFPQHIQPLLSKFEPTDPVRDAMLRSSPQNTVATPSCSVCRRSYLTKRAEWVEYWHCNMGEDAVSPHMLFLPFMRRACSWGCVNIAWASREPSQPQCD